MCPVRHRAGRSSMFTSLWREAPFGNGRHEAATCSKWASHRALWLAGSSLLVGLAIWETACGKVDGTSDASLNDAAPDITNVPFTCGTLTCQSTAQFCEHVMALEVSPDAQPQEAYYCQPLQDGCHSCECLKEAGYPGLACSCACIQVPLCTDDGGVVIVNHKC